MVFLSLHWDVGHPMSRTADPDLGQLLSCRMVEERQQKVTAGGGKTIFACTGIEIGSWFCALPHAARLFLLGALRCMTARCCTHACAQWIALPRVRAAHTCP